MSSAGDLEIDMKAPDRIGKYEVERRLGGGGMAEVFVARVIGAKGFSRSVAIKRVLPGFAGNPKFSTLFVAEAQISARLSHPNVVSVLDFDSDPDHGLFLVMELVEGRDLNQLLRTGLLPVPVTIYLITEILRGLGYAHHLPMTDPGLRGLVHRDVSPHNVLLSWEGAVKVSDFGIAKARTASDASASAIIKGKPAYMSPEQANGYALDGRSDLFAVGVMLWEMLVGQSLFHAATIQETLSALFFAPIPRPRQMRADIPDDIASIAMRLLQRQVDQRYATAEEVIRDLIACRDAPKDGRAELVTILQSRFAGQAPVRPPAVSPGFVAAPASLRSKTTETAKLADVRRQLGGMTPPSWIATAPHGQPSLSLSQRSETLPPRSHRRLIRAILLVACVVAAALAVVVAVAARSPATPAATRPAPAQPEAPADSSAPYPQPSSAAPEASARVPDAATGANPTATEPGPREVNPPAPPSSAAVTPDAGLTPSATPGAAEPARGAPAAPPLRRGRRTTAPPSSSTDSGIRDVQLDRSPQ